MTDRNSIGKKRGGEKRTPVSFLPYVTERDGLGRLLHPRPDDTSTQDGDPDTQSKIQRKSIDTAFQASAIQQSTMSNAEMFNQHLDVDISKVTDTPAVSSPSTRQRIAAERAILEPSSQGRVQAGDTERMFE